VTMEIEQLADVFVEVADTLVADFDLIEFLHTVARHAAEIGGSAAGLMLSGQDGTLHHVGASSDDARLLELFQIQNDEGPCLVSFKTGRHVAVPDLREDDKRWPRFAERAVAAGFASVYAFPMRLRDQVIGGLNVFQAERRDLDDGDARLLQALADLATISLIQERAVARADVLTEQLQVALNSRIVIEQAKGAVARTFGIGVDEAFELLRGHARTTRRKLTEVAHEVVTSAEGPGTLRRS
jgi:GAF domain-containing protein